MCTWQDGDPEELMVLNSNLNLSQGSRKPASQLKDRQKQQVLPNLAFSFYLDLQ